VISGLVANEALSQLSYSPTSSITSLTKRKRVSNLSGEEVWEPFETQSELRPGEERLKRKPRVNRAGITLRNSGQEASATLGTETREEHWKRRAQKMLPRRSQRTAAPRERALRGSECKEGTDPKADPPRKSYP